MEPNYSRRALICSSCWSITRGVTLAFRSPSVCFEICDNHSRLPFVTACSIWSRGKKAWPLAMQEFSCFQLKTLLLCSFYFTAHKWSYISVCVWGGVNDSKNMSVQSMCLCMCVIIILYGRVRGRSSSQSITQRGLRWLWRRGGD